MNGAGGGAALSTLGLIHEFNIAGIESAIVCDDAGSDAERRALLDAVEGRVLFRKLYWWNRKIRSVAWKRPLIEMRQLWQTGRLHSSTADIVKFANRHDIDLIHTNTSLTPEGGLAAKQLRIAHVWHLRELMGPGHPFRFVNEGPAFGEKLASLASVIVANSNVTADAIRTWLPTEILRIVPNGIDLRRFKLHDDVRRRSPIVIGMAANMTSWKKQGLFLEAAAQASPRSTAEFRIFGHLPSKPHIHATWNRRLASLRMSNCFRLAGFVHDPAQIMRDIDVLVHTAEHESFGRVVVEAMAAGLPVVGVRGGGIGEIIIHGQTGFLANPDDAAALARYIEILADNPDLRQQIGQAGRNRAASEYSVHRSADRMLAIYREAMSRPVPAA